jgi:hypothetical protein
LCTNLIATRKEIFKKKLIFGDSLNGFDEVSRYRVFESESSLETFEVSSAVSDKELGRVRLVGAVLHIAVEPLSPGDETVAHVFRHRFVLLQLLEEDGFVKGKNFFDVSEDDVFFAFQSGGNSHTVIGEHRFEKTVDRRFEIFDVRSFSF